MSPYPTSDRLEALSQFAFESANKAAGTRDREKYAKLAHKLHQLTDREIAAFPAELECKPGCSHCCRRLVTAIAPEVFLIAQRVRTWDPREQAALSQRLGAYKEATNAYWQHAISGISAACPFLEENLCSIYDVRPSSCRSLNSKSAEACREFYVEAGSDAPPGNPERSRIGRSLDWAAMTGFYQGGGQLGMFEMPLAVEEVLYDEGIVKLPSHLKVISGLSKKRPIFSEPALSTAANTEFYEGRRLFQLGEADKALFHFSRADHQFNPIHRLLLPHIYQSEEELELWWERWHLSLRLLESAKLDPRTAWEELAHFEPFFLAYAGRDVRSSMERLMSIIIDRWARPAFPELCAPIESHRRPGKLRVGFVGSKLTMFNGSRWALGWLRQMGPEIETFAVNLHHAEDDVSAIWRRNADHYYHLAQPIAASALFLRSLDLDAIIFTDIGMNGNSLQLASLRLARTQLTAWGHPVTSGSPMIDAYLSSELMEPPGADEHYTERLIRLPGSGLTYPRLRPRATRKSASDFGLPESGFYLVPQLASKPLPADDWLYREIGRRSGKPIVFIQLPRPYADRALEERLTKADVPAIVLPRQSVADYMRLIELADCSLDPPAWNGGNTTIEALSVRTPVVSLSGSFMRGRHARAFLPLANAEGLLARDPEAYIDLALDLERQQEIMKELNIEALYEDPIPAQALARFLLDGA